MSIICHEHEFIYLKTRKTASTSLQVAFSRVCKPGDTVTFISAAAKNYQIRGEEIPGHRGRSHNYPEDIAAKFPEEWKNYRKIAAVRNPYYAIVSTAIHAGMLEPVRARLWIRDKLKAGWLDNETFLYPFDGTEIDYVIRFEELEQGYQRVCDDLGIEVFQLPHIRKRGDIGFTYDQVLDNDTRALIKEHSARTLKDYYGEKDGTVRLPHPPSRFAKDPRGEET